MQDVWFLEKLAHFDREVIPERRMHAKGSGAYGTFIVTHDITRYTRAKIFSQVGKKTELLLFENTARSISGAPREVQLRHISNCLKADPAYGKEIATALGILLSEVPL